MTNLRNQRVTWVLLVSGAFLWSTNYVLAAILADALTPLHITFIRWSLGLPLLVAAAAILERPSIRAVLRAWPWVLLTSLSGLVGYNLLNYTALHFIGPTEAAVVNGINPLAIALLARVAINATLTRRMLAGIAISVLGVLLVVSSRSSGPAFALGFGPGELLVLAAVACWAVYTVLTRRLGLPPVTSVAAQALVAAVFTAPFFVMSPPTPAALTPLVGLTLALLVIFPTCSAFVLWNIGVARVGPIRAGVVINLMPVFTGALAFFSGLQQPTWPLVAGGLVVIVGVVIAGSPSRVAPRRITI